MNKTFCDFCSKELHLGGTCRIRLEEPSTEVNLEYPIIQNFDACQECFDKIAKAIGIKK